MTGSAFGLSDAEFWTAPARTKDAVQERLSREGSTGLFIDAPREVPLDGRTKLPVVGWVVQTLREARKVSFDRGALVAAVHLDDGRLHVDLVEEPRVLDPSRRGAKPDPSDPGEGKSYKMFLVDAHARLPDLPWRRGAVLTTVLLRGGASTPRRARSDLVPPPPTTWIDPVVAEAAAQRPAAADGRRAEPVRPRPGSPLPAYRKDGQSPPAPAAPGLTLAVPRRAGPGEPLVVRGSLALPLLPHQVVAAGVSVGDPAAKAVVPVDLVLTGDETPGPFHLALGVPVYDLPAEGQPAIGHFALDVLAERPMAHRKPQTYWLWGFAGEAMSGPHEVVVA